MTVAAIDAGNRSNHGYSGYSSMQGAWVEAEADRCGDGNGGGDGSGGGGGSGGEGGSERLAVRSGTGEQCACKSMCTAQCTACAMRLLGNEVQVGRRRRSSVARRRRPGVLRVDDLRWGLHRRAGRGMAPGGGLRCGCGRHMHGTPTTPLGTPTMPCSV